MNWLYDSAEISENDIPTDSIGFIYKIIHIPTGKYYIGKKSLTSKRTVKLGKRELAEIKDFRKTNGIGGRPPSKKIINKVSDWVDYWSSNDWIKGQVKDGRREDFKREIIQFCNSKKSLSYWEVYWQFKYDVLSDENYINNNIGGKYYRKDI